MGLLDWLTDGTLGSSMASLGGGGPPTADTPAVPTPPRMPQGTDPMGAGGVGLNGGLPPSPPPPTVQLSADGSTPGAPPPPMPGAPPPVPPGAPPAQMGAGGIDPSNPTAPPVLPPNPPAPPVPGAPPFNPTADGSPAPPAAATGTPPPVPMPQPRPDGAPGAPPPPGAPTSLAPPPPMPGAPLSLAPPPPQQQPNTNGFVAPPTGPSWAPDQQGRGGIIAQALGISPDQANRMGAALGKGFTAAGNSAGKSKMQALAGGAGAALEGGSDEQHKNTKDAQGYLTQAIAAKKAGDDAAYKTNYVQYLKLKSEQDKVSANKNDSPTQLYLAAQRNVAADPLVKGAYSALQQAQKSGNGPTDPDVLKAQQAYQQTVAERQQAHLAGVGLHPQTAAEIAKQPGMTEANPIDAKAMGITQQNIGQKLQRGQIYRNPSNPSEILRYNPDKGKGAAPSNVTPAASKPAAFDPSKTLATADEED